MRVTIVFPSGSRYVGETATDALRKLSKAQWDEQSRADVKRALAWRYFVSSGGTDLSISEFMDDDEFLDALAQKGFIQLEREGK